MESDRIAEMSCTKYTHFTDFHFSKPQPEISQSFKFLGYLHVVVLLNARALQSIGDTNEVKHLMFLEIHRCSRESYLELSQEHVKLGLQSF